MSLFLACAGCQQSVEVNAGQSSEVLAGFSWSVLLLLGAVLIAVAGLSALVAATVRKCDKS